MADNVIVRVPEQQFIRGEDGYSPVVTIENIDHGHSITITDREHQEEGQTFNVLDGDSAYEQAVAGGYTGTEAQFNEELASFKELSDETKEAAPFYAEYGVTTRAEIEAAINDKRQIYLLTAPLVESTPQAYVMPLIEKFEYRYTDGGQIVIDRGYRFSITSGTNQYIAELANGWTVHVNDLSAPATRAEAAADQALIRMNSADASAQAAAGSAGDASTAATTATTKAGEASDSATAADGSAKDSEAYAIGKRDGTDVGSSDPAYHNNAKYYAEQAALIVDDVEQVMTSTAVGPASIVTFDASVADMPLKGLTVNIKPAQAGSGDPSPENIRSISGWTTCKLHRTGVSLIGGDAFIGNTFSKTANGYQLSYNGSSISSRASAYADIRGIPAGRYTIEMLNPSYPEGAEVNIRRSTAGNSVTMGLIIGSDAYGTRTYNIPENTTSLQLYIIPGTMPLNTSITMSDIVLVREGDISEPYKGNTYDITFPSEAGTVYGGTLDVVNRKLNSYPYYSSYNGETIIGPWISSMDVYTPGATPTLGAQVVDMGGAATSYDLSDVPEITTLFGENNIWANRGDVTVTYGAYLETVKAYADQAADSAAAAEDAQAAAEAVLASIPEDYTELSGDVDNLKSAFDALLLDGVVPYYKLGDISGTRSVSKTIDIAPGAYIFSISNIVSTDVNTGTNRIIIAKNGTTVYDKTITRGAFSERIILSEGADTISVYASDNYAHSSGDSFTFYDVTFSVEDKNTDAIAKIQSSISRDDDLLGTKNYFNYYDFVTGALTNTGAISANSFYVTTDFIPVIPGKRYTIVKTLGAAYTRYLCYYDADKVYIPDSYVSGVVQNLYIFQVPNGAAFLRISISAAVYNENPVFSLETNVIDSIRNIITPENQCFSYAGNQLDLALNNKYLASRYMYADGYLPSGKTAQGFAIYGKYLFQFFADDYCRVYDTENNGAIVAEFTAQCGHGNGVCFSEQFNSATDDFPIIYLSDINGNVYQCAISLTACTLIKTLYFDSAVFGFAPEIVCDGNDYYVYGKQSDSDYYSTAIISKVDISNLTDNGNSTYTPAVLDSFTVNVLPNSILQGCKAKNGYIYACSGGHSTSVMANLIVIDCTSKTVVSTITDFPELVKIHELEDLELVPNAVSGKYDIVVHVRLYGYFRFVF